MYSDAALGRTARCEARAQACPGCFNSYVGEMFA